MPGASVAQKFVQFKLCGFLRSAGLAQSEALRFTPPAALPCRYSCGCRSTDTTMNPASCSKRSKRSAEFVLLNSCGLCLDAGSIIASCCAWAGCAFGSDITCHL